MATTATHPYLGTLQKGTTDIGQIISFTPPKRVRGSSPTTHLASSNMTKTSRPGWIAPGDVAFKINMIAADYTTLRTDFEAAGVGTISTYRYRLNDGSTATNGTIVSFSAWIRELGKGELSVDSENPITVEGVLEVTGIETYTAAA